MLVMGGGGVRGGGANCLARQIEAMPESIFFSKLIDMARQCKICINKYP